MDITNSIAALLELCIFVTSQYVKTSTPFASLGIQHYNNFTIELSESAKSAMVLNWVHTERYSYT